MRLALLIVCVVLATVDARRGKHGKQHGELHAFEGREDPKTACTKSGLSKLGLNTEADQCKVHSFRDSGATTAILCRLQCTESPGNRILKLVLSDYEAARKEVDILTRIKSCPHVSQILNSKLWRKGDDTFGFVGAVVMEDHGNTLHAAMPVQWNRVQQIGLQMVDALRCLKRQSALSHNDISPRNILYDPETQEATLIDFGMPSRGVPDAQALALTLIYSLEPITIGDLRVHPNPTLALRDYSIRDVLAGVKARFPVNITHKEWNFVRYLKHVIQVPTLEGIVVACEAGESLVSFRTKFPTRHRR
eukprot:c16151_g1_i1.p1 GENE.c16151_g1_i1~~c16151_g1_i1.p1  ORF type:complete len:306 (-),score=50.47 c16151_g1_i1:45-962(-)